MAGVSFPTQKRSAAAGRALIVGNPQGRGATLAAMQALGFTCAELDSARSLQPADARRSARERERGSLVERESGVADSVSGSQPQRALADVDRIGDPRAIERQRTGAQFEQLQTIGPGKRCDRRVVQR